MRARNPCVLARLRLFGWKVRLLMVVTHPLRGSLYVRMRRKGAEPDDCILGSSEVSTTGTPADASTPPPGRGTGCSNGPIWPLSPFPVTPQEFVHKLWTMWKTQDSCGPDLWTTPDDRLLAARPSGRIGGAARTFPSAAWTLKTPAQTAWPRSDDTEAPVALRELSTTFRAWRGHRRPLSTESRVERVRKAQEGCATPFASAFGFASATCERPVVHTCGKACGQVGKTAGRRLSRRLSRSEARSVDTPLSRGFAQAASSRGLWRTVQEPSR